MTPTPIIKLLEGQEMPNTQATLLIVDDEPSIRYSLEQSLAELGYDVRSSADGFSALREIQQEVPALLLSDLNMPGMSGFELLKVVRRRFPAIRTIAMSGSFSGDEVPSGVAADAYYQKGSSILALVRIMDNLPQMERFAYLPSSPEAPLSIQCSTYELSPDEHAAIACPKCRRTIPQTLGAGCLRRETDCIYCNRAVPYAIVPQTGQMPLQSFQRKAARAMPYQLSASHPSN
jgi:CheY-like chemotaxis protein